MTDPFSDAEHKAAARRSKASDDDAHALSQINELCAAMRAHEKKFKGYGVTFSLVKEPRSNRAAILLTSSKKDNEKSNLIVFSYGSFHARGGTNTNAVWDEASHTRHDSVSSHGLGTSVSQALSAIVEKVVGNDPLFGPLPAGGDFGGRPEARNSAGGSIDAAVFMLLAVGAGAIWFFFFR